MVYSEKMKRFASIIFIFSSIIYVLLGLSTVFLADLLLGDENWHFAAASLVAQGKVPYRDFAYFHLPLAPYFYAVGMYIFGSDLVVARVMSFLLGVLTLVFIYIAAKRLKGPYAGIFAILPIVFNFNIIHRSIFLYHGSMENFLLSLFCLSLISNLKPQLKYATCVALLALIQGVRVFVDNITAYIFLFIIFIALTHKMNKKVIIWMVGSYIITSLLLYLPSLILAPQEFLFNTLTHYFSTNYVFNAGKNFGLDYNLVLWVYDRIKNLSTLFRNYYIIVVSTLLMAAYAVYHFFKRLKYKKDVMTFIVQRKIYLLLAMQVIISWIFYLGIFGHHLHCFPYHTFPAWAIMFGCGLIKLLDYFKTNKEKVFFATAISVAIVFNFFTQDIEENISSPSYSGIKFVNAVSAAIQHNSKPNEQIFAFSNGYVLHARRNIFLDTIYDTSDNSLFPKLPDNEARKYKVLSPNILLSYFKDKKARVAVIERPGRLEQLPVDVPIGYKAEIEGALLKNYNIAEKVEQYPGKDIPQTIVYIYKVKDRASQN